MSKVTVIGDTSSGKTSFLYAMYNFIAMGYVDGFTMSATDNMVDYTLQEKFAQLANATLGMRRFPGASTVREVYEFELQYGFQEIAKFEWIDYPGGYISENGEGRNELTNDLRNSDAWVIFIDGEKLLSVLEDEMSIIAICGKYNRFVSRLINQGISIPKSLPIIITKGDLIANSGIENWKEKVQETIKQGISPCFTSTFNSLVSISTVSLGSNIADNNFKGELDPINIEYPITISMLSILNNLFDIERSEDADLNRKIEKEEGRWWASDRKLTEWQRQIDAITPKLVKWQKMAKAILNTLHDEKSLWYSGEKLSMVDYYHEKFLIN
ncbi:hypothetical protein FACS189434_14060 [Bacteroidia bacterium]|nr:hypothetical protein FACS189434_14060 [Bacteroidia bacterium]